MPRAVSWHHNIGSTKTKEYCSVETLPDGKFEVFRPTGLYCHTNHLIHEKTKGYEYQDIDFSNSCSTSRLEVLTGEIKNTTEPITNPNKILKWMSSHQKSPWSPCRHPDDKETIQTVATAFFDFKTEVFRIYKGNPCEAVPNRLFENYRF